MGEKKETNYLKNFNDAGEIIQDIFQGKLVQADASYDTQSSSHYWNLEILKVICVNKK